MPKFRKRPVEVEAVQLDEHNARTLAARSGADVVAWHGGELAYIVIPTPEGKMRANKGDWIIQGVEGEFYPCKDSVFQETYERVE